MIPSLQIYCNHPCDRCVRRYNDCTHQQRAPDVGDALHVEQDGESAQRPTIRGDLDGERREAALQRRCLVLCPLVDVQHLPRAVIDADASPSEAVCLAHGLNEWRDLVCHLVGGWVCRLYKGSVFGRDSAKSAFNQRQFLFSFP